jgi:hypothetical protein
VKTWFSLGYTSNSVEIKVTSVVIPGTSPGVDEFTSGLPGRRTSTT